MFGKELLVFAEEWEHEWWAQRERAKAKRKDRKIRIENMIGGSLIE